MATEEAKIVVTIERGAFKSSLKGMEGEVAASGRRMKGVMSGAFGAGMGNVKNSIKGMFSGIGQHMRTAMTLGGAVGAAVLIKDALQLQTTYRNIAYNVSKIPGQAMKWQDVQVLINKSVEKTGGKAEDLAMAFDHVFKETGRLDVAKGTLEAIGTMATATGGSMEAFADVATRAVEKFNIGVDRLPEALAQFESLTGVGGPQLDELGRKFGMMAGAAADAGFTGEEGMRSVLTMMTKVDDLIGEKAEPALKSLFQEMATGSKSVEAIEKKLGRKFTKGEGGREKMGAILAKGGSVRDEFIQNLSADAALGFKQLVPAFDNAMRDALATGKSKQEATALAVKAFDDSITGAGKKTRSYAENVEAATKRLKEDPALQMQKAMNKLQEVMTSPKALEAIKRLMDSLPKLAEGMGGLLKFILDHPIMAGGLAVGGKLGMSFLGGAGGKGLENVFSPGRGGTGPGGGVPLVVPSADKMKMSGAQIGQGAVGVIAAAGIGYSIGTAISEMIIAAGEEINKKRLEKGNELSGRGELQKEISGLNLNTPEGLKKAGELKERLKGEQKAAGGRLSEFGDLWSNIKSVMAGGQTGGETFKEETKAITSLGGIIHNMEADKARQDYFNKLLGKSAEGAAKALDKIGGKEGGGHGPPKGKGKPKPGTVTPD